MKLSAKVLGVIAILIALSIVFVGCKAKPKANVQNKSAGSISATAGPNASTPAPATKATAKLSFDEAKKIAEDVAREKFGANSFVVPAGSNEVSIIKINGVERSCYVFGADDAKNMKGSMKGLYHIDGNTGEVFDNGSGTMVKVR